MHANHRDESESDFFNSNQGSGSIRNTSEVNNTNIESSDITDSVAREWDTQILDITDQRLLTEITDSGIELEGIKQKPIDKHVSVNRPK